MNHRFDRHFKLYQFGKQTQEILLHKKVLIIGCGGIGCSAAINIISNGVGTVGLMDKDTVSLSNLHRQYGHSMTKIGISKVDSLYIHCKEINPECNIIRMNQWFEYTTEIKEIVKEYDLILDCTDNPKSRILINKICKELRIPFIFASAIGWDAQLLLVTPDGPCIECVFPKLSEMTDTCTSNGVFGPVPSLIGTLQAIEGIKYLTNIKNGENGELILFSSISCELQKINVVKDNHCKICNIIDTNSNTDVLNVGELNKKEIVGGLSYYDFLKLKNTTSDWLLIDISNNTDSLLLDSIVLKEENITKEWIQENKNKQIYIICNYGTVSSMIVNQFRKQGIDNIWFIEEGIETLFNSS